MHFVELPLHLNRPNTGGNSAEQTLSLIPKMFLIHPKYESSFFCREGQDCRTIHIFWIKLTFTGEIPKKAHI